MREYPRAVLSVGGGVVSEKETYDRLLASCFTVWVKANPEDYMARVMAAQATRSARYLGKMMALLVAPT